MPPRAHTRNVVLRIAGQQLRSHFISVLGQPSGITGQRQNFAEQFGSQKPSMPHIVEVGSHINQILQKGIFSKDDTFTALVFDAQFNFELRSSQKYMIVASYIEYVTSKLGPEVETVYIAGHSRGGCLAKRLSARLAQQFPTTRIITYIFDTVCAPGELGVTMKNAVSNPAREGYRSFAANITQQFPFRNCVAVWSFMSGGKVAGLPI